MAAVVAAPVAMVSPVVSRGRSSSLRRAAREAASVMAYRCARSSSCLLPRSSVQT